MCASHVRVACDFRCRTSISWTIAREAATMPCSRFKKRPRTAVAVVVVVDGPFVSACGQYYFFKAKWRTKHESGLRCHMRPLFSCGTHEMVWSFVFYVAHFSLYSFAFLIPVNRSYLRRYLVQAIADIPAGEECLISYGNLPNSEVLKRNCRRTPQLKANYQGKHTAPVFILKNIFFIYSSLYLSSFLMYVVLRFLATAWMVPTAAAPVWLCRRK